MTTLEDFANTIRSLSEDCPSTLIILPPHSCGCRDGVFNLSVLLQCIVLNLEGKKPECMKVVPHV